MTQNDPIWGVGSAFGTITPPLGNQLHLLRDAARLLYVLASVGSTELHLLRDAALLYVLASVGSTELHLLRDTALPYVLATIVHLSARVVHCPTLQFQ